MHRHLLRLRRRLLSTSAAVSSPLLSPPLLLRRCTSSLSSLPPPHSLSPRPPRRLPPDPDDPSTLLREDPISLCASLWIDSFRDPSTTASSLSPHLRRLELWVLAYQKTYADETGSYLPKSSVSRPALESLLALRNAVLDGRFRWGARLDFFIRSPRDKTDPSSLSKRKLLALLTSAQPPPFQDRIVQEVLLMILKPIYEARFSKKPFAFRPGRTPHTVIRAIRRSFVGYLWYIKGDLQLQAPLFPPLSTASSPPRAAGRDNGEGAAASGGRGPVACQLRHPRLLFLSLSLISVSLSLSLPLFHSQSLTVATCQGLTDGVQRARNSEGNPQGEGSC